VRETGGGQTSYAIRHFKKNHNISIKEDEATLLISNPSIFATASELTGSTITSVATKGYKSLISTIDATRFRKAVIIFFVMYSIAFSIIESSYLRNFYLLIQPALLSLF
jgi:hypothetical protein